MSEDKKGGFGLDDDDDFTVANRDDIVGILRNLGKNKANVSAIFNGGSNVVLTQVIGVEPKDNAVYLDTNANAESNNELLQSKRTFFSSVSSNATVKWLSDQVFSTTYQGYKAFRVILPEKIKNIQRRGVYRVATPIMNPIKCRIPYGKGNSVDVSLVDICVEGIGASVPPAEAEVFQRGAEFKDCTLFMPEVADIKVNLIVQAAWEVTMSNGQPSKRAGFLFVGIKQREQAMVQRFVHKMDSIRIATLRGR